EGISRIVCSFVRTVQFRVAVTARIAPCTSNPAHRTRHIKPAHRTLVANGSQECGRVIIVLIKGCVSPRNPRMYLRHHTETAGLESSHVKTPGMIAALALGSASMLTRSAWTAGAADTE